MKKFLAQLFLVSLFATFAFAQTGNPCNPDGCRTQTQGGWGTNCNGNNPGCLRDNNFAAAFPSGLTVGGTFTIHFSTSAAVNAFLPAGGTGASLTSNHNNPTTTEAGVFAGQVASLALSLGFSNAHVSGFCSLGSLYYKSAYPWNQDPFVGMTVQELFDLANDVLGGDLSGLPVGTSLSNLNDVITAINENFDNGTHNDGNLVTGDCDIQLAVELNSFTAVANANVIELMWSTSSESDVARYEIERTVNGATALIGSVNGLGDSPVGHSYRFTDRDVTAGGSYTYRLMDVSTSGARTPLAQTVTVEAGSPNAMPTEFALYQNYPNPFNPSTEISFSLPEAAHVKLTVFDPLGRSVATLANGSFAAGTHELTFDASGLSNGIYFYQIQAGDFSAVRKMTLLK